ncbi:MAG: hypothetical protein ABIH11_04995 [Candidatus Altiarchaeota archaeon]
MDNGMDVREPEKTEKPLKTDADEKGTVMGDEEQPDNSGDDGWKTARTMAYYGVLLLILLAALYYAGRMGYLNDAQRILDGMTKGSFGMK